MLALSENRQSVIFSPMIFADSVEKTEQERLADGFGKITALG